METGIANAKLNGLSAGTINVFGVDIANINVRANSAGVTVNTLVIAIADSRMENDIADIENAPIIGITSNCLKEVKKTGT